MGSEWTSVLFVRFELGLNREHLGTVLCGDRGELLVVVGQGEVLDLAERCCGLLEETTVRKVGGEIEEEERVGSRVVDEPLEGLQAGFLAALEHMEDRGETPLCQVTVVAQGVDPGEQLPRLVQAVLREEVVQQLGADLAVVERRVLCGTGQQLARDALESVHVVVFGVDLGDGPTLEVREAAELQAPDLVEIHADDLVVQGGLRVVQGVPVDVRVSDAVREEVLAELFFFVVVIAHGWRFPECVLVVTPQRTAAGEAVAQTASVGQRNVRFGRARGTGVGKEVSSGEAPTGPQSVLVRRSDVKIAPSQLQPFALVARGHRGLVPERCGDLVLQWIDALDPAHTAFCLAVNRANCLAYDGAPTVGGHTGALGMPRWVMLDCCLLPSAVFGYSVPRAVLDEGLARLLDPEERCERLAISEYIAIPAIDPQLAVGASLFSLAPGHHLGRRTKALALRALGRGLQIGVTQWTNPSLRLHLAFGPLLLLESRVWVHSRPAETFVYGLTVPEAATLEAMAMGTRASAGDLPTPDWVVDPRDREAVQDALRRADGPVAIVEAGEVVAGELAAVGLKKLEPDHPGLEPWRGWLGGSR